MKATLNRHPFTATAFDSGSLGALTSVIHQFSSPGRYVAVVQQAGRGVGSVVFEASEASTNLQLDIDLSSASVAGRTSVDCDCKVRVADLLVVSTKGYVLFHASKGEGYSTAVGFDDPKGNPLFDSTKLREGDLYALSLLRPAKYSIVNSAGKAKGTIEVTFSQTDAKRLRALETQYVQAGLDTFTPANLKVTSTQGIVFRVTDAARIVIETDPEEPLHKPRPSVRFVIPKPPIRK
jgi:hypothetical protein